MENSPSIKRLSLLELTDDVWFEIYLRLPLDSIFKFRSISKVWFATLSSPNFINKWYELNYSSLPWGLLHFNNNSLEADSLRKLFTIAYPDLHSQFIENHQNGFSLSFLDPVLPNSNDPEGTNLFLIGSSSGLVLCTTNLFLPVNYYVCNPLTKKWVSLPPPPPRENNRVATGFICNGCFSESTGYKVIRIPKFEAATKEFQVEIFSSDLGEWNVYDVSCAEDVICEGSLYDNYVTHNGVFYWFQKENSKILAVSVNLNANHGTSTNKCRFIDLPHQSVDDNLKLRHHLGESEGLICYAIVDESERSLSVWVLKEDWCLLYKDNEFHDIKSKMETSLIGGAGTVLTTQTQVLGFNPVDKNVVILGYKKHIWGYNFRTKGCVQLCHPFFLRNYPITFYASALATGFTPRPTMLPPLSWSDASILDAQISN